MYIKDRFFQVSSDGLHIKISMKNPKPSHKQQAKNSMLCFASSAICVFVMYVKFFL